MGKSYFKIDGMAKLKKDIAKLGKVPQKHVTASARKGMSLVLKDAKTHAPVDTGLLKKGMKLTGERSRLRGKKVYRIVFNEKMNDDFQKPNKDGKVTGYYPFSQEYGYFAVNGRYIPGYRFIHNALQSNKNQMKNVMIMSMKSKIDAEIAKAGLK